MVESQIQRKLKQSRMLVDHAADGNIERIREELRGYAHPDSKREGVSALTAALKGEHTEAIELLLDFRASLQTLPLPLSPKELLMVTGGPKTIDFGTVSVFTSVARNFTVMNELRSICLVAVEALGGR